MTPPIHRPSFLVMELVTHHPVIHQPLRSRFDPECAACPLRSVSIAQTFKMILILLSHSGPCLLIRLNTSQASVFPHRLMRRHEAATDFDSFSFLRGQNQLSWPMLKPAVPNITEIIRTTRLKHPRRGEGRGEQCGPIRAQRMPRRCPLFKISNIRFRNPNH